MSSDVWVYSVILNIVCMLCPVYGMISCLISRVRARVCATLSVRGEERDDGTDSECVL